MKQRKKCNMKLLLIQFLLSLFAIIGTVYAIEPIIGLVQQDLAQRLGITSTSIDYF